MKTKKRRYLISAALIIFALIIGGVGIAQLYGSHEEPSTKKIVSGNDAKVWVLSDPHFIADSLHDFGSQYTYMMHTAASKDLKYQSIGIKSLVKQAIKDKPNAIVITGDLTFNGEYASIKQLEEYFKPLKAHNIKMLVIPGNHDIYDGWARKFSGDEQTKVAQISPADWKNTFVETYEDSHSSDPASLSTNVQLNDKYQLVLLDTNYYSTTASNTAPVTGGYLRDETLSWLKTQLEYGKKHNLRTVLFTHHNIYQHSTRGKEGYVIDNVSKLNPLLEKYDVKLSFAGHIHAQDIAADPDKSTPTVEVLSSSFAVAPKSYGVINFNKDEITYQKKNLDIRPFLTSKQKQNKDLANYPNYLKKLFYDDTKAIMYERLFYKMKDKQELMDEAATAFADVNWHFFTGTDDLSSAEIAKFTSTKGYQALIKYGGMKEGYAQTNLNDTNMNDNKLTIKY